jgi:molybdopterin/thiamine biosynthesis adenylyltransferase
MSPRPKLKSTNPAYDIEGSVWVPQCGATFEIEDTDGDVRELLALLDGSRTVPEVLGAFQQQRPGSTFDVSAAIGQLDENGLLEDAAAPTTMDSYELERWKRNLGFFETYATMSTNKYAMQEQLKNAKVALLGCGGVGSHVAFDVLGLGVAAQMVVDFDKVELSNLNRQILYTEGDVGQRKLEIAVRRLRDYNPNANINGIERKLTSVEDVEQVVAGRDFVFCAVDRPKMQVVQWVNEACVRQGVPFVGGGVETQRSVLYLINPGVTGCMECWRRANADTEHDHALRDRMAELHTDGGVGPDLAAFGPMVTILTMLMVTEFVRFITGIAEPIAAGRLVENHFADLVTRESERWDRLPDCPVCKGVEPRK